MREDDLQALPEPPMHRKELACRHAWPCGCFCCSSAAVRPMSWGNRAHIE